MFRLTRLPPTPAPDMPRPREITQARSASEGVDCVPRLRFGLVCDVSNLTGSGITPLCPWVVPGRETGLCQARRKVWRSVGGGTSDKAPWGPSPVLPGWREQPHFHRQRSLVNGKPRRPETPSKTAKRGGAIRTRRVTISRFPHGTFLLSFFLLAS